MKINNMIKKVPARLWILVLLFFTIITIGQAHTVISGPFSHTGSGTTSAYPNPLQDYYETSRQQFLYTSSELAAQGITPGAVITNLGWIYQSTSISGHLIEGFTIRLKNTSSTSLPALGDA